MGEVFTGIGVGSTAVRAPIFRLAARTALPELAKSSHAADAEFAKVQSAIAELERVFAEKIAAADGQLREILEAQAALAGDPELADTAAQFCKEGWNAASSIQLAMQEFKVLLQGAEGEFGERVADLDEIVYRLVQIVNGNTDHVSLPKSGAVIVVAHDLTPMDTVAFTDVVVGVITEKGGPTSHTAIVCRSRGIPALVACKKASQLVDGDVVVLDPDNSQVIVGGELAGASQRWWEQRQNLGRSLIPVMANVGSVKDAQQASSAAGVGLLRTELFFLDKATTPTRQEQIDLYATTFAACPDGEIIVRTLDAGSDKPIPFLHMEKEENPALGVRGQRVAEVAPDFYREQVEAIGIAAAEVQKSGKQISVSVMAPMIATIAEAKDFAAMARAAGITRVGVMVEIPAIVSVIPQLKGVIDFVSVGTNDLSQYLFAADRVNSNVAHLLNPWEPALLSTLAQIAQLARENSIKSGVCGEAASDPLLAVVLAGLGFDSVSASPSSVADVVQALSVVDAELARSVAASALSAHDAQSSKQAARKKLA
jgi:phosphotransferase system enzyme I (PtsI)